MRAKNYNNSFKENAVRQLLMPGSPGLSAVADHIGIPRSTLFSWKKKCAKNEGMKNQNQNKKNKNDSWTAEKKLEAIIKTGSMSENERGEYLRSNGLHSSDLESFKEGFIASLPSKGRPKVDPEMAELKKKNKALEKDLRKKDKALAEFSARVILLKKSHEIWGEPEDGE